MAGVNEGNDEALVVGVTQPFVFKIGNLASSGGHPTGDVKAILAALYQPALAQVLHFTGGQGFMLLHFVEQYNF